VGATLQAMDAWGISDGYWDVAGAWHRIEDDVRSALLEAMGAEDDAPPVTPYWSIRHGDAPHLQSLCEVRLEDGTELPALTQVPGDLPTGYHELQPVHGGPPTRLVVAPRSCPLPPQTWGWSAQLYATRSRWSWGIGDLGDLRALVQWTGRLGGRAALVNPLHANAPVHPQQPSPYYPSSRRFRNVIYLRVADVPGATLVGSDLGPLDAAGRALNAGDRIDRDEVLRLKMDALGRIFAALGPEAGGEPFQRWRAVQGVMLEHWSAYCALAEIHGPSWWVWPDELRRPDDRVVTAAAGAAGEDRLRFHAWCQWLIDEQLRTASAGTGVAVLQDLAVGFEAGGFDGWCDQDLLALTCRIGAPPDELGPDGQDWGLPPYIPWKLRAARFEPFREAVRAVLVHAGGLRIDHVMGLFRQYWLPPGAGPNEGGYVRFPAPELLDIVAIEASRQGAFVIGEDLGTVEPEVSAELRGRGILGTTLGWFEDIPPEEYEPATVVAMTTHDLPTAAGVATGADAAAIHRLGRTFDDSRIRRRLRALAPEAVTVPETVLAAYAALANAPTQLVLAQLDDAICNLARPNLPGTVDEWPNWCLPLPVGLEELMNHPFALDLAEVLGAHRGPDSQPRMAEPDGRRSRASRSPSSPAASSAPAS
jgi:4-alpha-glucanotransferase